MRRIQIDKGMNIRDAAQAAINEAQMYRERVMFEFNDICLYVSPESFAGDIAEIYQLKHRIRATQGKF